MERREREGISVSAGIAGQRYMTGVGVGMSRGLTMELQVEFVCCVRSVLKW